MIDGLESFLNKLKNSYFYKFVSAYKLKIFTLLKLNSIFFVYHFVLGEKKIISLSLYTNL